MICPKCGRDNPEDFNFCPRCGAPLQAPPSGDHLQDQARKIETGGGPYFETKGDANIVVRITEGISKKDFDRFQSENCTNDGRKQVVTFGERASRGTWDWHPLGRAIEYFVDAIRHYPDNQHAWVNLAYVYHVIGERQKARDCLKKGYELATPGPNFPGRHYKSVESAITRNVYLSGGRVNPPDMPEWFQAKYAQFL